MLKEIHEKQQVVQYKNNQTNNNPNDANQTQNDEEIEYYNQNESSSNSESSSSIHDNWCEMEEDGNENDESYECKKDQIDEQNVNNILTIQSSKRYHFVSPNIKL